jgi:hypothetical protein
MISDGRDFLRTAPWISLFPGLAIGLVVLGFNLFGTDRDAMDPRLRAARARSFAPPSRRQSLQLATHAAGSPWQAGSNRRASRRRGRPLLTLATSCTDVPVSPRVNIGIRALQSPPASS